MDNGAIFDAVVEAYVEENMEMTEMATDEVLFGCKFNPYLKKLLKSSDLELLQEGNIRNLTNVKEFRGSVSYLFMTKHFIKTITEWTKSKIPDITVNDIHVYMALEMGMSLIKMNEIANYWSSGKFIAYN